MQSLDLKSIQKLQLRQDSNSLRVLGSPSHLIDFSSNDYLRFSKNETIYTNSSKLLAIENLEINGASGSRLLTGNHNLYDKAEQLIAQFHSAEKALIFNSGYSANIGLIPTIAQRHDIIFYDELCHASIREGISLAHAKAFKFKHNNLDDLEEKLSKIRENTTVYVITESVFSMDGDSPDMDHLIKITKKFKARLIIDEAHALGVFGENGCGLINANNSNDIFARVITFGKALGCHGAAVLGSQELIHFLINFSRAFIYTTGLPPHAIATIFSAYKELKITEEINQLQENIQFFKEQLNHFQLKNMFIPSDSAIQCAVISGNKRVKAISKQLEEKDYNVKAILSPTVPINSERLRFCLHSYNSKNDISSALKRLKSAIK